MILTRLIKRLMFLSISALFFSCASNETAKSDTVSQEEVYQSYSIDYDASSNELDAHATFRFGGSHGTTLSFVSPSKVTLNGKVMPEEHSSFSGTYYKINKRDELARGYTFVYINNDNKTFENSINISPVEVGSYDKTIKKSKSFTVSWESSPISDNEEVTLYIEGSDHTNRSISTEVVGSTSITAAPGVLEGLNPGPANIYLKRSISYALKEGTHLGGRINATYTSKKAGANIE